MQNCSDKLKFYLFADDTKLLYADRNLKALETVVNCELLSVYLVNCKQMKLSYFPPLPKKAQPPSKSKNNFDHYSKKFIPLECKTYIKY